MSLTPYFSSSSKVWESRDWIFGLEEIGYVGWEIVADGKYRLDNPENFIAIQENLASTGLRSTVHAPYSDLNLASLNYPIWRESIRQTCCCIRHAADLTDRVTIHPGFLSPVGKLVPEKVWEMQKTALVE
ncbi:MAG TPA: TIM barrel protein, partial [Methanoculleus sp.]|nr:TIM barrel protein [Methanoculleus sp.]